MAENDLSQNASSVIDQNHPIGPIFIDDDRCRCALQTRLSTEAWRCLDDWSSNLYSGDTGKWFFAVNPTDVASLRDPLNSDRDPPNLTESYRIDHHGQNAHFVSMNTSDEDVGGMDKYCTGKNDTQLSSLYYGVVVRSQVISLSPCWQPGMIALTLQNASGWNATGCNLGFLCKRAGPFTQKTHERYASNSHCGRSEQHSR